MKGGKQMETVTINSDKIKQAVNNYIKDEELNLFESCIGKPIYSFTKMFFNAITFDLDKFENTFKCGEDYKEYEGLSIKESILKKYGEALLKLFENKIICNQYYAIGVIMD